MDRIIPYLGAIPLDTDFAGAQQNAGIALGYLARATLGAATVADGLLCRATVPASLAAYVEPGSLTVFSDIEQDPYGGLPANTADPLMKMGINTEGVLFPIVPPAVPGQSQAFLIQAAFYEGDDTAVVLPYYNPGNPAVPFTGPNNSNAAQNTRRFQRVALSLKAGIPSAGAPAWPAPDPGQVPLWVVTADAGALGITGANIQQHPLAPFPRYKLPQLAPGMSSLIYYTASQVFLPASIGLGVGSRIKVRLYGGGGAGGSGGGSYAGGGGSGAGYFEGYYIINQADVFNGIALSVGAAGTAGASGAGGTTSWGSYFAATGGGKGTDGSGAGPGGGSLAAGTGVTTIGSYNEFVLTGGAGSNGAHLPAGGLLGGHGGACAGGCGAFGNGGQAGSAGTAMYGPSPGSGGAGAVGNQVPGNGAVGLAVVEY